MTAYLMPARGLTKLVDPEEKVKGAPFTVRSRKTGKDYTFKVKANEFKGRVYSHLYVEQNYMDWKYLGHIAPDTGSVVRHGAVVDTPSATAASWIFQNVKARQFAKIEAGVELMHLGKCIKCGKTLTDAVSIEYGIGPVCRGHNF